METHPNDDDLKKGEILHDTIKTSTRTPVDS